MWNKLRALYKILKDDLCRWSRRCRWWRRCRRRRRVRLMNVDFQREEVVLRAHNVAHLLQSQNFTLKIFFTLAKFFWQKYLQISCQFLSTGGSMGLRYVSQLLLSEKSQHSK